MMEKVKQNKFVRYINGKMNMKHFWVLIAGICFLCVVIGVCFSSLDTDMFFMISTGDRILDKGIPYTNVWSIDKNASMVAQQWLYCVILSVCNKWGVFGCFVLSFVTFIAFIVLLKKFFKIKGCDNKGAYFLFICLMFSFSAYLFKLRPETITLMILLIECFGLELFKSTGHKRWLYLLPVSMLLEINMHASMWPLHYAILLAYFVPSFSKRFVKDTSLFKQKKSLILPTLLMTGAMFINPYGVDAILYILQSMSTGVLNTLSIEELAVPTYFSASTITLLILISACIILYKCNKLESVTLYITLGLVCLALMKMRNNMFNSIPLAYVCIDLYKAYSEQDKFVIDWKKDIKRYLYPLFAFVYLILVVAINTRFDAVLDTEDTYAVLKSGDIKEISQHLNTFDYDDDFTLIADYLEDNDCYHKRIFTGFNTGAYMEYLGCDNIFIDARPEIYHHKLNGSNDFILEYINLVTPSSISAGISDMSKSSEDYRDFLNKFTEKYQFDYAIIDARLEEVVYGMYLESRDDYEIVPEVSTKTFYLYRKIQ